MPDPDLVCEIRTEVGVYRDWLTVQVMQSFDEPEWNRHFRLTCAEPDHPAIQRLLPKMRVDVSLAGKVVIQEGYIKNAQAGYDANRHFAQVVGYSKAGPITEVSASSGQYKGNTLEAIANAVLKPHGLKFRMENPPKDADLPFPSVRVHHGETPFALISRLARQRGVWLYADKDGTVVGHGGSDGSSGIVFEEGKNILGANRSITMPEVDRIIANSQQPGSDSLFGKKAAEIGAKAPLQNGEGGFERRVLAEMPLSQKEVQLRANMEVQALEASLLNVSLSYQGWLHPGGDLWGMKEMVTVKSPMIIPTKDGKLELKLWGYSYTQNPEGQTTTSIELVSKAAFAQQFPQSREPDNFYNRKTEPAQPEEPT